MCGPGPSEPDLPPAYVAVHAAYQRLTRAEAAGRRRRAVEGVLAVENERLERLLTQLRIERAEAEVAESRLRRPSLVRSRRRRLAELEAERADVVALRSEIAARRRARQELAREAVPASSIDPAAEIEEARRELDAALASWQAAHRSAGSTFGNRLDALERRAGDVAVLIREVDEAIVVARRAAGALVIAARSVIRTPTLWNPNRPDRLGTRLARVVGRNRVTTAEIAVGRFQRWLLQLDAELGDLLGPTQPDPGPPPSLHHTMNRWFDEVYSEWLVHGQIDLSARAVADCRDQLKDLADELIEYRRDLRERYERIEEKRRAALLEHPGIV